MSDTWSSIR